MYTTNEFRKHIINYIRFLQTQHHLAVTLHPYLYEELIGSSELIQFHNHKNLYCEFLKKDLSVWRHCLDCQNKVYQKCLHGKYCGICHAGVREFVYPIHNRETVIGFLCVTGYKAPLELRDSYLKKTSRTYGLEYEELKKSYDRFLSDAFPDQAQVDTLIMPLLHTLELAYMQLPVFAESEQQSRRNYIRILHYIHLNYNTELTLTQISHDLNFSKSYISHNFKANSGYTINQYINLLRLQRAKDLLVSTDMNMTEISTALGFSSSNYFTIAFKKIENLSPTAYRKKCGTSNKIDSNS